MIKKYQHEYTKWQCLIELSIVSGINVFYTVCSSNVTVSRDGRDDCQKNITTAVHQKYVKANEFKKKCSFMTEYSR